MYFQMKKIRQRLEQSHLFQKNHSSRILADSKLKLEVFPQTKVMSIVRISINFTKLLGDSE